MEPLGRRRRGRPKRRFMDEVMEDMRVVFVTEEDSENREKWRQTEMGSKEVQILCYCTKVDFSGISTLLHYLFF